MINGDLFQETIRCLKPDPTRKGYFLLTEPHLLYLSKEQSNTYLKAMGKASYASSFHGPTVEIIKSNLPAIFADIGDGVSLIDLGPGFPDKSLPMAHYLRDRRVPCKYVPVDISEEFLESAAHEIRPWVGQVYPVRARFEDCASRIPSEVYGYTTYCMIGLTFMNFPAEDLLPLLKGIAGGSGRVVIASELLTERKTPEVVLNTYRTEEAQLFGFWPLAHLGFQRNEVKCRPIFSNGCVQMCYRLEREPRSPLQARGLRTGDVIVTAVSYRYTKEQLDRLLARHFLSHQVFCSDDAGTAVAVARN